MAHSQYPSPQPAASGQAHAEVALEEHGDIFSRLHDGHLDVSRWMYVMDVDLDLVMWSRSVEERTGLSSDQLLRMPARMLFPKVEHARFDVIARTCLERGHWEASLTMHQRNGDPQLGSWHYSVLEDLSGNVVGVLACGDVAAGGEWIDSILTDRPLLRMLGRVVGQLRGATCGGDASPMGRPTPATGQPSTGDAQGEHTTPHATIAPHSAEVTVLTPTSMGRPKLLDTGLASSHELLLSLLASSPNGYILLQAIRNEEQQVEDFTITLINPAAEAIANRTDLLGQRLLDALPGLREEGLFDLYVTVVESGQPIQVELEYALDGISGWFQVTCVKLRDGLLLTIRDVTQLKQTEQSLRDKETFFQNLLGSVSDPVWAADLTGERMLYLNPAIEHLYGRSREDFETDPRLWLEAVHPEDRETAARSNQVLFEKGEVEVEYRIVRPDGEVRWLFDRKVIVRNGAGSPLCLAGIGMDITGRKITEEKLRVRNRAIASTSNGIIIFDARPDDMFAVYVNPAFERITGYSLHDLKQQNWLVGLEYADEVEYPGQKKDFNSTQENFYPVKSHRKDGSMFYADFLLSPVVDQDGNITHFVGSLTDSTQRREAQEKLVEHAHRLRRSRKKLKKAARALHRANHKLMENQAHLVQSEKMASLGQLAAGVAHEINNPVGFLLSNLGTLAEYAQTFKSLVQASDDLLEAASSGDRAAQEEIVKQIQKLKEAEDFGFIINDIDLLLSESLSGGERVKDIVQSLKSFARMDEPQMVETDVNECVRATLRMLWNELKYKCDVHERLNDVPLIRCHPGQINQVLTNLLMNAGQAISDRGDICVETEVAGSEVVVRVSDTGSGIAPEHLPKLFTPFFTTKPVGKGTGLGLSISYGIIEKHGGSIDVESTLGKGTTFTVRLPVNNEETLVSESPHGATP